MTLFDGWVVVDWSASDEPKYNENSIWVAVCDSYGTLEIENLGTRQDAIDRIDTLLSTATAENRRLLCGFDFAFGYPVGTAQMLTGHDGWEAIWELIARVIEDGCDNTNNRFEAAAELNETFDGEGPFWGMHHTWQIDGLLHTRPEQGWGQNLPPERRYAEETVPWSKTVWQLFTQEMLAGRH